MNLLQITYHGATLALEIGPTPSVTLRINGLVRDEATSDADSVTLRVNSTVQTDYEWHEFIEGVVRYDGARVLACIIANKQELIREEYGRVVTP